MAYLFGDSFDFYTSITDGSGWWDSVILGSNSLVAGRFAGGQAVRWGSNVGVFLKNSGSNDATHHIIIAIQNQSTPSTSIGCVITLGDGATGQCCICFRADNTIELRSGSAGGTVLATYSNAFPTNVWTALEFEITINNTTGAIHVRKNGAASDDFSATSLNTRGGTANNYANRLTISGQISGLVMLTDDLLWFSTGGVAPNTWVGDVRAYQLMPTTDSSVQFTKAPNPVAVTPLTFATTVSKASGNGFMVPFTASYTGTISSASVSINTGGTGNLKAAIYDATRTTALATSNAVVNPVGGNNAITFGTPLSVTKGTLYHIAFDTDFTIVYNTNSVTNSAYTFTTAYASFPAASPTATLSANGAICTINIAPTINAELVSELQEDGTASYVYDSTVSDADLYNVADLPANTSSIVALTTRAYMEKSDAGARTGRVQLKSGATTVTADLVLPSSFSWCSRTDTVDPNTSSAWTLVNANAVQIGPVVAA